MNTNRTTYNPMIFRKNETSTGELMIEVIGDMDFHGCKVLRSTIKETFDNLTAKRVVLNLSKVIFLDEYGIGAIDYMHNRAKADNRIFQVTGMNGEAKEALQINNNRPIPDMKLIELQA